MVLFGLVSIILPVGIYHVGRMIHGILKWVKICFFFELEVKYRSILSLFLHKKDLFTSPELHVYIWFIPKAFQVKCLNYQSQEIDNLTFEFDIYILKNMAGKMGLDWKCEGWSYCLLMVWLALPLSEFLFIIYVISSLILQ